MNATNKTLYIPLYGKALVSGRGIILRDEMAERIWAQEGFPLKGKAKSKWLAYYMGMRASVMDNWLESRLNDHPNGLVLHLGCGLDSRCLRVKAPRRLWIDADLPAVAEVRRQYYEESEQYRILSADVTDPAWLEQLPQAERAFVVLEGISMYLPMEKLQALLGALQERFPQVDCIVDVYTDFAVKISVWKNPIKSVGASACTGVDRPKLLEHGKLRFAGQLSMTPEEKIAELPKGEQLLFRRLYAGKMAEKIYHIYTYRKEL